VTVVGMSKWKLVPMPRPSRDEVLKLDNGCESAK
jgi:hypothetical protein